jgi:hypothetical protein
MIATQEPTTVCSPPRQVIKPKTVPLQSAEPKPRRCVRLSNLPLETPRAPQEVTPSPGPIPQAPVPAPKKEMIAPDKQAEAIDRTLVPAMLATALGMDHIFDAQGYRAYLDKIHRDFGSPTDPAEKMMVDQLVMAHFCAGRLLGDAGQAQRTDAVHLLSSAGARLLCEFRMTALALRSYRAGQQKPRTRDPVEGGTMTPN